MAQRNTYTVRGGGTGLRFLNFGSLNIDYVYHVDTFLQPGETKASQSMAKNCGGKGLNQSIALALAGARTVHAGCIGQEGAFLQAKLEEKGVDCHLLRQIPQPNGHAIIQINSQGQNCILLHPGANFALTTDYIDAVLAQFGPEDILVLQNETNNIPYLMRQAAGRGMRIAFNAAPMDPGVKDYPLETVTWLLVNETEGKGLTGMDDPKALTQALSHAYPHMQIVLTLGKDGCLYRRKDTVFTKPSLPVQPQDTTAAGDTFTGYFLAAAANGADPEQALTFATAAAAIAITRPGAADSIPTKQEVLAFMQGG